MDCGLSYASLVTWAEVESHESASNLMCTIPLVLQVHASGRADTLSLMRTQCALLTFTQTIDLAAGVW